MTFPIGADSGPAIPQHLNHLIGIRVETSRRAFLQASRPGDILDDEQRRLRLDFSSVPAIPFESTLSSVV